MDYHISGQLKVAPEHCVASVLDYMGKPHFDVFERFWRQYQKLNEKEGKQQYLVPYLMSSHPGCTLEDSVRLAEFLHRTGHQPQQVQDFYPTPGTLSTCMYYTGIDPRDMTPVYVARDPHEKALQRALLQWKRPELRGLVIEALEKAGRTDLIGYTPECSFDPRRGRSTSASSRSSSPPGKSGAPDSTAEREISAGRCITEDIRSIETVSGLMRPAAMADRFPARRGRCPRPRKLLLPRSGRSDIEKDRDKRNGLSLSSFHARGVPISRPSHIMP